jgi:fructose-1,6-bisphosphatase II / sedoheptulose-1,7-bisphosphatase
MTLDKELLNNLVNITSSAAISSFPHVGKKNKELIDKAATDDMRKNLNKLDISGEVVIGEGELDEAPMLYIGEKLGTGKGPFIDIAVDPVEGTNFVANNLPGALSVIAVSNKGNLFHAPETYMNKIAVGNDVPIDAVDLDFSVEKNIKNIADVKNKDIKKITACLLDRPRHKSIIEELIRLNVNLKLITDGDVSGALLVTDQKHDVDIFLGIGGGPEGVLAASALDAFECKFQGRFLFKTDKDIKRAKDMGIDDLNKKYDLKEIVKGDSIFCATGITSGDLVNGVKIINNHFISETLVTHKSSNFKQVIKQENKLVL